MTPFITFVAFSSSYISVFCCGLWVGLRFAKPQTEPRLLPLPMRAQTWKVEGIGSVRIVRCDEDEVTYELPRFAEASPFRNEDWGEQATADLETFERVATLEFRK